VLGCCVANVDGCGLTWVMVGRVVLCLLLGVCWCDGAVRGGFGFVRSSLRIWRNWVLLGYWAGAFVGVKRDVVYWYFGGAFFLCFVGVSLWVYWFVFIGGAGVMFVGFCLGGGGGFVVLLRTCSVLACV